MTFIESRRIILLPIMKIIFKLNSDFIIYLKF
jgi:hypothetical protein